MKKMNGRLERVEDAAREIVRNFVSFTIALNRMRSLVETLCRATGVESNPTPPPVWGVVFIRGVFK